MPLLRGVGEKVGIMRIAVGVTTAPRPETSYLVRTIESIDEAGFNDVQIFADSPPNDIRNELLPFIGVHRSDLPVGQRLGSYKNWKRALETILDNRPDCEWYLIFQDDVRVAKGLQGWLETQLTETTHGTTGVGSLFCLPFQVPEQRGWHCLKLHDGSNYLPISGACALLIPQSKARSLLQFRWDSLTMVDLAIGHWCHDSGLRYWRHFPSLVEHVGIVSSIDVQRKVTGTLILPECRKAAEFCDDCDNLVWRSRLSGCSQLEAAGQHRAHRQ